MLALNVEKFALEVKSLKPVLVDFWAEWCGPCRVLSPVLDELSKDFEGKIKFFKVNVDENPELSQVHGIMAIPTVKIFKNGEVIDQFTGAYSKNEIKKRLEGLLK